VQDLAAHLQRSIADYRMRDAKVTDGDVAQAVAMLKTTAERETRIAVAVIAGCVAAFVVAGIFVAATKGRLGETASAPVAYIAITIAIAGTIIGVLLRRSE
jgi:hypothetical protein